MNEASTGPLDPVELKRYCDWDDQTACYLKEGGNRPLVTGVPILQGSAPSGRAVFAALLPKSFAGRWFLHDPTAKSLVKLAASATISRPHSEWRVEHISVSDLSPAQSYQLLLADGEGNLLDLRSFTTLPNADAPSSPDVPLRVALFSCADDRFSQGKEIWGSLFKQEPQLLIGAGNLVYANQVEAAGLWNRYAESANALPLYRAPNLVPTIAIWNDLDFGLSEGDHTNRYADEARETFEAFFPSIADAKSLRHGPGVAKSLKIAGHTFVLFDNRSFRTPNARPAACAVAKGAHCQKGNWQGTPNDDESHFGRVQDDWALEQIRLADGPVWLISGDQWFGEYHPYESFAGNHPRNFRKFLTDLKTAASKNASAPALIFASGDRQATELQRVQPFAEYDTFEITSSPIQAVTESETWRHFPNSRQIAGASETSNFVMVAGRSRRGGLSAEVSALGPTGATLFTRSISVDSVKRKPKPRTRRRG